MAILKANGAQYTPEQEQSMYRHLQLLRLNKYHKIFPSPPQQAFMLRPEREILYGGEGGAGKTAALCLLALQYVDVPHHSTVIFRKSIPDMMKEGNALPLLLEWLAPHDEVIYNKEDLTFYFPSGATITIGYMASAADREHWKSAQIQDILWEEATDYPIRTYRFMLSRNRRKNKEQACPLRIRPVTNPGGEYHEEYKDYFLPANSERVETGAKSYLRLQPPYEYFDESGKKRRFHGRVYIHAVRTDNPGLDVEEYEDNLIMMDEADRARFDLADWELPVEGAMFDVSDAVVKAPGFKLPYRPTQVIARIRYWDTAATAGGSGAETAGVLMSKVPLEVYGRQYIIEDVVHGRWAPHERDRIMRETAERDGTNVKQWIEQEPGGSGKQVGLVHVANMAPYPVDLDSASTDKVVRAQGLSSQWNNGNCGIVQGAWNAALLESFKNAPTGRVKDIWDGSAGAFNKLAVVQPAGRTAVGNPRPVQTGYRL
jgi:phage terminase large subunit-like protein